MNQLIFEGRFLVNMAGSIIRQDALSPIRGGLNWEKIYRNADYHRLANMVYIGLLGKNEHVPARWREHFFERYQESLLFGEICSDAEKEILTLLEMKEISCIILASTAVRDLYQVPEMASNSPLILYMDMESYIFTKGYLVDLGYETDRVYSGCGERLKRVSGFTIEIYHDLPFITSLYKKTMLYLLERAALQKSYQYIRGMSASDRFVFRMAQAVYHYVTDELLIREILDLYLYHRAWAEQLNQDFIKHMLIELQIDQLAAKLLSIGYMWFGDKGSRQIFGPRDDMSVYDVLENRILSRGALNKESDTQALELTRQIQREEERERRAEKLQRIKMEFEKRVERFKKKMSWIFPELSYMRSMYPWLEKAPILLPVSWLIRGTRLISGMIKMRK